MRLHHGIDALLPAYLDPDIIDDDDDPRMHSLTRFEWRKIHGQDFDEVEDS